MCRPGLKALSRQGQALLGWAKPGHGGGLRGVRVLSMVIALSMSRACQPHGGALLLCMVVSDSIHRTCKSDVSAL
jgi:hypothetical protein